MATDRISPSDPPSADQLSTERATRFHQDGNALLTVEAVRTWLSGTGLALYLPRPDQLPAPAPSFVEATLGAANTESTPEQIEAARSILARLISEGACVPLNLLGATGASGTDTPDFVCSPATFSFLFTLRGNKAWKTAPMTSGPVKVSPLALAAYDLLVSKITLSAYDLTTQLGKEVTEVAVLRALTELWQQLRVLPVPQTDGSATLWELATARFTKQIKAGANAGQPTALSALISLYLNQAIAATEDEVETFLSPLAPRSRLRSVMHDLIAARQLETVVVDGKTLVHIAGDLPTFSSGSKQESKEVAAAEEGSEPTPESSEEGSRIRKFAANPASKLGTGLRAKPAFEKKPGFGSKPAFGSRPAYGRPAGGDRDRRPFDRDARPARPAYNKPWNEDRPARPSEAAPEGSQDGISASGEAPRFRERPAFRPKPSFGDRLAFRDTPASRDRPERPRRDFGAGASRPPRPGGPGPRPSRPFGGGSGFPSREGGNSSAENGSRRTFSKPGTFGRKREGGGFERGGADRGEGRPPRRDFTAGGEGRPPRREFGEGRPSGGTFGRPGGFKPRAEQGSERSGGFAGRKPFPPREGGDRPPFAGRPSGGGRPSFGGRPSSGGRSGFASRPNPGGRPDLGARPNAPRPEGGGADGEAPRRTFRKFDAPRAPRPYSGGGTRSAEGQSSSGSGRPRPSGPGAGGFTRPAADRPAGDRRPSSGGSRPPSSFAGKGGPFAKFADGKKPFRKPGKPSGGGFTPVRRKRPEDES